MNVNLKSAREIFIAAVRLQSDERNVYLDQACEGDVELHSRVDALLRAHEEAGSFAESAGPNPSATIAAPFREKPGTVIGPYKLLQQIGEGGMGTVYMAEQTHPVQRKVALKVIKAGMDSGQVIARFEAERQALAMMDHVNIARVLDAGTIGEMRNAECGMRSETEALADIPHSEFRIPHSEGRPYFVMELVHGVPITKYCDDNHLTPRERLELFVPVCQAIQHAHQKGIIHRDIKPSNVMVTLYDGKPVPKVIDFGVAKAIEQKLTERTLFTQYGSMVGTLEYMSPEQAEMSALGVDTRSDVYSLGVLLYELLTGSTPLTHKRMKEAAYAEILRLIKEEEPPRPSTRLSDSGEALASISANRHTEPAKLTKLVRGELDWIVMKTLEKDRNRRYETAKDFAADMQRYLNDETVQACPPSAMYRFRKFSRRNKVALATTSVVSFAVVLAVAILAVSNVRVSREKHQKEIALTEKGEALAKANTNYEEAQKQEKLANQNAQQAMVQTGIARANEKTAQAQTLLARQRFYASQMNLAMQAWQAGEVSRVLGLLESQRPKVDEDDLRSFEWYYLWRLCQGGCQRRLPTMNHDNSTVLAISPDGLTLASGFGNTIKLWDTLTGREKGALSGHRTMLEQVAWTPDGKTLVSSDTDTIRTWDLASGKERTILATGRASIGEAPFAVAGDSNTLLLGGPTSLSLWDLTTGRQVSVVASGSRSYHKPAIVPDGRTVAAYCDDGTVKVWSRDGDDWRPLPTIHAHSWQPSLAFSPDGKVLAVAGMLLKCYDPTTGQVRLTLSGHSGYVYSVNFSADGKVLTSGGQDQTAQVWDATGRKLASLAHPVGVHGSVLSADGKVVATTASDGIRVWDTTAPQEAIVLQHTAAVSALAFSRDGMTVASAGLDGTKLWHLGERKVVATLPAPARPPQWKLSLAFSPDGETLATGNHSGSTIEIWSITGERQAVLEGHTFPPRSLAFSPDGKSLASASDDANAILWDLGTRQPRARIKLVGQMSVVAFSPDGKTLAAGSQFGVVKLFEAATGRETSTLQRFEFATTYTIALAFSPDSTLLAASNAEGLAQIWEVATGRLRAALKGHVGTVWSLSFAPDGRTVATAGDEGTVKLWDVATGQERCTLKGHNGPVFAVEFAPDGNTLVTGGGDGTVRLWPAAMDANARARKEELEAELPGTPAAYNELGDALYQYGRTAEAEGAYGEALARLEKLSVTFPESFGIRQEMIRSLLSWALVLEYAGRPAEVGPARERARKIYHNLSPDEQRSLIWGYCERGRKLSASSNHRQAELTYSQAVELAPTNEQPWSRRGSNYTWLGEWEKAAADYTKAIELNPEESSHWKNRGTIYTNRGEWEKAAIDFAKAEELAPGTVKGFLGFVQAMASWKLGHKDDAHESFHRAAQWTDQHAPKDSKLHRFRGIAAELLGLPAPAPLSSTVLPPAAPKTESALRQAIRLQPNESDFHHQLGLLLFNQGKFVEAEPCFREVVRLKPDLASGHCELGEVLRKQSKFAEATAALREAIRLEPTLAQAHHVLGWVFFDQQQFPEAEGEFRETVRLKPELVSSQFGLGRTFQEQKKFAEALAPLREAVQLEPTSAWVHDALGWALVQQQQFSEAEVAFREEARLKPELAAGHFGLGRVLVDQKKFSEAETALRETIRLDPKHPWAHQLLGRALTGQGKSPEAEELLKLNPPPRTPEAEK